MQTFKTNLQDYAARHKREIVKNPILRAHFQQMCTAIGVDPLMSSKGWWCDLLVIGDFYYELGVQICECCLENTDTGGGLIEVEALCTLLARRRGIANVSRQDVVRAVETLSGLHAGYRIIKIAPNLEVLQSRPVELTMDGLHLISMAAARNGALEENAPDWLPARWRLAIDALVADGMAWIDRDADAKISWWFPCHSPLFTTTTTSTTSSKECQ